MEYCRPDSDFSELRRLVDSIEQAAGFRSEFRGVAYIDIDEWIGHEEEKHFITLMKYLADNAHMWMIILGAGSRTPAETAKTEGVLSVFLRIEKAVLELPQAECAAEYMKSHIKKMGFIINEESEEVLNRAAKFLSESKYFEGYNIIDIICSDIAYNAYTSHATQSTLAKVLEVMLSENGEYLGRIIKNMEYRKTIGFGRE